MASIEAGDITIDVRPFTNAVCEGKAEVDFPSSLDVFYNPVQEFNRDISIAVLRLFSSDYHLITSSMHDAGSPDTTFKKKITESHYEKTLENIKILDAGTKCPQGISVLEALAASGLRSIRYAREVGGIKEILANDLSRSAIDCMKTNLIKNKVEDIVTPSLKDASLLMYEKRPFTSQFQAVDLDPYGSPHIFLDGAVQCVADGGLLLVTCTDMAVLCGVAPETCFLKYGSLSMKTRACHEMALRIVLQSIESHANKYGRYIVPLISMSADFYVRVFVRIFTSQKKCKESFAKMAWVHSCTNCESSVVQRLGQVVRNGTSVKYQLSRPAVGPLCEHCGGHYRTAGPVWADKLHDRNFIGRLKSSLKEGEFTTYRRIHGTLTMMEEELEDAPFYYVVDKVAKVLKMSSFKMKEFMYALCNAGYKASPTHCCQNAVKTNAPPSFIWDIMRAKNKLNPVSFDKYLPGHAARAILFDEKRKNFKNGESHDLQTSDKKDETPGLADKIPVSFEPHINAQFESDKLLRFQINPQENWGPKSRAVTSIFHGNLQEKSKAKQGKRKRYSKGKNDPQNKRIVPEDKSDC